MDHVSSSSGRQLRHSSGAEDGHDVHIHAIDEDNFMIHQSLAVRGRSALLSWRNEEIIEEDIFQCSVMGRLERVRYLVEVRRVQVNQRDRWDSTPLYYACLAGHEDLVRYLLEKGARCEENTFDGERCFHAALTNDIRRMLREYKAVSRAHDPFTDFLRNSFFYHADDLSQHEGEEKPPHSDIHFIVNGTHAWAHRVFLAARSSYFNNMFRTRWKGKRKVLLAHPRLDADAFKAVVHYLYTERLQVPRILLDETEAMVKQCKLWDLHGVLQREIKKENVGIALPERVVIELADIYRSTETQRTGPTPLQLDLGKVAMRAIRGAFGEEMDDCEGEDEENDDMFEDIIFSVEGKRFKCHKFFFCGRSEYFQALVMGNFKEGEGNMRSDSDNECGDDDEDHGRQLRELELSDVSAEAFAYIVDFIYTDNVTNAVPFIQELKRQRSRYRPDNTASSDDTAEEKGWHLIYEVLRLSDMYMLPVLRNLCAVMLSQIVDMDNLFDLIDLAELMSLERLQEPLVQFMALNLEDILLARKDEFAELVRESAYTIANRQATDTIPVIDDIRSALDRIYPTDIEMEEADHSYEDDEDWEDWEDEEGEDKEGGISTDDRKGKRISKAAREMPELVDEQTESTTDRAKEEWTSRFQILAATKNHKLELLDHLLEELGLSA